MKFRLRQASDPGLKRIVEIDKISELISITDERWHIGGYEGRAPLIVDFHHVDCWGKGGTYRPKDLDDGLDGVIVIYDDFVE